MNKFCPDCGTKFPEEALLCQQCGKDRNAESSVSNGAPPPKLSQFDAKTFINFEVMITPIIMKIIYLAVSVVIVFGMLFTMFNGGTTGFFLGIIGGLLGLVYWRIFCELLMLFFSMHKELVEIKNKLK